MPSRPHLHLRNLALRAIAFRPYSGGRQKSPAVIADRVGHARQLRDEVDAISDRMSEIAPTQDMAQVPKNKRGMVITATGFGRQDLWLGDMKASSPGVSLLAARSATPEAPAQARLFVGQESLKTLYRQLGEYEAYGNRNNTADKPMRFTLFESTSEFRPAELTDVWTGATPELPGRSAKPVETWIRSSREEYFYRMLERLKVDRVGSPTKFTDSVILDIVLTRAQMEALLHGTGAVIEFRPSSHFVADFRRANPGERREVSAAIARRIVPAPATAPRTVILDSGVASANPLLAASLAAPFRRTIDLSWGTEDDSGHGTNMAGVALFPDLAAAAVSTGPIVLTTALESVKNRAPARHGELDIPPRRDPKRCADG
ncbi:hypothetical protein [Hansschlegelia zhihuaiae]|uniref:Peptidase S8/S53 domain-containing protein n=1 Tax=Hansschlegelia zhihuaiae TaxID=405005 RepID=A0A4Q0MIT8_9HYPH|nr:hypothetical protein [Hansschlegelia zhihuaiae]RXF72856.1 hypothetical protein EK403_13590 [Hansschlegelia zhihuaiae]